ncbi:MULTISPECIES: anaerobic ribonucleoside-triphosphate reductase activating protein [unclassified Campylobacter]|uniref:anaerobic ribonucleoside-triphosphate reductase activating protein n=1 Tax=unclassified Campylobacter TaxID=2593542 RepID=UPI003D324976
MNAIYSLTPFTMTDYPDKIAAVAWFAGCNMRCAYCYNTPVVLAKFNETSVQNNTEILSLQQNGISDDEFVRFLDKRVGKLDGVVFSGGECTLARSFLPLAREVKQRNLALKVDTNGSNLIVLKQAISENLIDYIALDFKATKEKFHAITGLNFYENFIKTLEFLLANDVSFEVRTTIHTDLLNEYDISQMAEILWQKGYIGEYFLQNFLDTGKNFGNICKSKNCFDPTKINSKIPIKLRNFQ